MAPMRLEKRGSPQTFDDSEDDLVVSLSARSANKRQRLSYAIPDRETDSADIVSVALDETSDDDDIDTRSQGEPFNYEDYRDAPEEHDAVDEAAHLAEQRLLREELKKQRLELDLQNQNRPVADNAIIEQIDCTNFMCHSRLTLNLGPLINFIIGHNGSGKSAALTALQLCLGSKVATTNRGGRLADFIKHGSDWASLSIKIKNQGPSAYMPELYGPSIVVERHFTRSGTSGFKLKNSQGKIISTKKADLDGITDAFTLQLDNPMMCLTQDQARQFINDSSPAQKYMFFFKGTQLEALDRDYKMLSDTLERIEDSLDGLLDEKRAAKRVYLQADQKVKESEELHGLQDKYHMYSRQMAWVQVSEQEKLFDTYNERVSEAEAKIVRLQEVAESIGEEYTIADQACNEAKATLEETQKGKEGPIEERTPVSKKFEQNQRELEQILAEQRAIKGSLKMAKNKAAAFEEKIAEEEQRISEHNDGRNMHLLEELSVARNSVRELEDELSSHAEKFPALDQTKLDMDKAIGPCKAEVFKIRNEIERSRQRISSLEANRGQWLNAYKCGPDKLRSLLKAIENNNEYREKPVGPMGQYIQLLEPKWSSILETSFGGSLGAFVCTSIADQKILVKQMRQLGIQLPTFIGHKAPMDTRDKEPELGLLTWLRALKFENDLVRNTCIIHNAIEQTVLIEDDKAAREFMFDGGGRPKNVKATYSLHDTAAGFGWRLTFGSSNAESRTSVSKWMHAARMKTDTDYEIKVEQQHLQKLNRDNREAEQAHREAESMAKEASQALVRHKQNAEDLRKRVNRAKFQVEELDDKLQAAEPQENVLDAYALQLQEASKEVSNLQEQFEDAYTAKEGINAQQRDLLTKIKDFNETIEQIEIDIKKAEKAVMRIGKKREDALYRKNEAIEKVGDAEKEKEEAAMQRDAQREKVESFTSQAITVSRRVAIDRGMTLQRLEQLLKKTVEQIQRQRDRLGGDREQLMAAKVATRRIYNRLISRYRDIKQLNMELKQARMYRIDKWRQFRQRISIHAKNSFDSLLQQRSYRGELMFNHLGRKLDVRIEPDATRTSGAGRQTKTLSGGEKSFSTICLLLALWDAMGSPVRCLDEFDVFMDQVNRSVAVDMIIDGARDSGSKQFILISPQSMKQDIVKKDVTVIKMSDPERGQLPLPDSFTRN